MIDVDTVDWAKGAGLVPAVVQDAAHGVVLMLGYMNREALEATLASRRVTFFSRSKGRLWTKGETSGHYLELRSVGLDCDGDALLVLADPAGPACHTGTRTCWGKDAPQSAVESIAFLGDLESIIRERIALRPAGSYTAKLLDQGTRRMAQKVGEAADLLYHTLLLLNAKGLSLAQVVAELAARHTRAAVPIS